MKASPADIASPHISVSIDTGRLLLRPLATGDAELYCGLYTDADIMRFIGTPLSRAGALRSFRKALRLTHAAVPSRLFLTVVEKTTQQAIGLCSIESRVAERSGVQGNHAETGIILCASSRAHGRAREALSGAVALAFAILPLQAVSVRISAGHRVAERLVLGLGFRRAVDNAVGFHDSNDEGQDTDAGRRLWSVDRTGWERAQPARPVSKQGFRIQQENLNGERHRLSGATRQ